MTRRALVPLVAVAVLLLLPAGAVEALRPLRTLTFDCAVSVADRRDTQTSHIVRIGKGSGVQTTTTGSGEANVAAKLDVKGSISVEVLSATDDAGLVVIRETPARSGQSIKAPTDASTSSTTGCSRATAIALTLTADSFGPLRS